MLKYRNFGKKSLNEIKDKLEELQLGLGLKFEPGLIEVQPEAEKTAEEEDESKAKKK
jgi:DNA-directed RNA polymerase subunit alpha